MKNENVTVRLDPKLFYGLNLLCRKQRRSISTVLTWVFEKMFESPKDGPVEINSSGKVVNLLDLLWDSDPGKRLNLLVALKPELLTYEEEKYLKDLKKNENQ